VPCVLQPVTRELIERHGAHGPRLQAAMFQTEAPPPAAAVEDFAERAAVAFGTVPGARGAGR